MKKIIPCILLLLSVQQLSAFNFFDQLCAFNPNWKNYASRVATEPSRVFYSDKEYIQAHLSKVLTILHSNPADQLTKSQYRSRQVLIGLLDQYRIAGNFPINYYRSERIPVFIDPHRTHCAVGYLLQQTGYENVALRIAAADNYVWVKDIQDAELLQWQQASGFTLEELKLIQGAYDSYMPNAHILPNKYEIPQKPACITRYFETVHHRKKAAIWCRGEGENNILNGRWEQNYAAGMPWIIGYFEHGKRTGQWMEYYQGTQLLCRTEHWSNDKLNGVRKRFDRSGNLIEEILFEDGKAITKTNYDQEQGLTWVRRPLDSTLVWTEILNASGSLIAKGHETVFNPGNLLWFQNIELTALNSAAITSRELSLSNNLSSLNAMTGINGLYNTPPLVQYIKEGEWMYYKDCSIPNQLLVLSGSLSDFLPVYYVHFGNSIAQSMLPFREVKINRAYDSVKIVYSKDLLQDFYGYDFAEDIHLHIGYYPADSKRLLPQRHYAIAGRKHLTLTLFPVIKELGQYNIANEKTGTWKHFTKNGVLYKTETFIIPQKEMDETDNLIGLLRPDLQWNRSDFLKYRSLQ